jgi:hypothetical protein
MLTSLSSTMKVLDQCIVCGENCRRWDIENITPLYFRLNRLLAAIPDTPQLFAVSWFHPPFSSHESWLQNSWNEVKSDRRSPIWKGHVVVQVMATWSSCYIRQHHTGAIQGENIVCLVLHSFECNRGSLNEFLWHFKLKNYTEIWRHVPVLVKWCSINGHFTWRPACVRVRLPRDWQYLSEQRKWFGRQL